MLGYLFGFDRRNENRMDWGQFAPEIQRLIWLTLLDEDFVSDGPIVTFANRDFDNVFYNLVLTHTTWLQFTIDHGFFDDVYIETFYWALVRFHYRTEEVSSWDFQNLGPVREYYLLHGDLDDVLVRIADEDDEEPAE